MPLGQGPPVGVVTTLADITAYVQAREATRLSEERYRGLVETLPVMVLLADEQMRIQYVNPAVKAITGFDLADIAEPALWAGFIHPEDLPRVYEVARLALGGEMQRMEVRYRSKSGREMVGLMVSQPRLQEGVRIGTTTLMLDVTRERRLEQELQQASRLELIGRLASGVAHDFNNLLGVVLNLVELARGHLAGDHPVNADLQRIAHATEQATNLAGQLLALSKQRARPPVRVDVDEVVRRTLDLLRTTLPGSISVKENVAGGAGIMADETQVQQVLMNLCLNARDAMPRGGVLEVTTECQPTDEGARVVLRVRDTGRGISDEEKEQIFKPFYSTREGGTGLGLAMVQQIVESQGGRIEVHSTPGQGALFEVRWPAA